MQGDQIRFLELFKQVELSAIADHLKQEARSKKQEYKYDTSNNNASLAKKKQSSVDRQSKYINTMADREWAEMVRLTSESYGIILKPMMELIKPKEE